jgi:hypothetical protein
MRWFFYSILFCLLPSAAVWSDTTTISEADNLLLLAEQQTESIDTLDTVIDSTLTSSRINKTLRTRLVMDKTKGMVKVQQLDAGNTVTAELLVQGTTVSVRGRQGDWKDLPMDAQSQGMLESMGVRFGTNSLGGIAGLEKSDGAALAAASAPASVATAEDVSPSADAQPMGLLRHRGWSKVQLDKAYARAQKRVARLKKKASYERLEAADDPSGHLKALRVRRNTDDASRPWDEELQKVDENTGVRVESVQFIRVSRWPGGKDHIPAGARHLHQIVPEVGTPANDDEDLVEVTHHKVLSQKTIHGAVIPLEAESVSTSQNTVLTVHTSWKPSKVNAAINLIEFKKNR